MSMRGGRWPVRRASKSKSQDARSRATSLSPVRATSQDEPLHARERHLTGRRPGAGGRAGYLQDASSTDPCDPRESGAHDSRNRVCDV
eukprot:5433347-Prymnesium_polylepis.1